MRYHHTQYGVWHWLLALVTAGCGVGVWLARNEPWAVVSLSCVTVASALVTLSFVYMTVADEGDRLAIRFGPLPLLSWLIPHIRYDEITAVEADRTSVLDGWGIHWIPGRGTTINIWGFDCVRLDVGRRTYRIGTDDVANLVAFLQGRVKQFRPNARDR